MRALNIFVNDEWVGILSEESSRSGRPCYRLDYREGVREDQFISLTLPTSRKTYLFEDMPLCLKQNFPEGERLARFLNLKKVVDISDDFSILSIIGQNMIGRLSFSPEKTAPQGGIPKVDLNDITQNGRETFERLLNEYGFEHGVSGVQEKVLSNVVNKGGEKWKLSASLPKTLISQNLIIKSFSPELYPALAENEFWTTRASQLCGIPTVEAYLSHDFSSIAIKRFDLTEKNGRARYSVDEVGALMGFTNDQKYLSSYETIADSIYEYSGNRVADSHAFFSQLVFLVATRNGDAHMKNFAFISNHPDSARLAPAYDLVSTGAYVDYDVGEFENPALVLENERWEKHWWSEEQLKQFGEFLLEIEPSAVTDIFNQIEKGLGVAAKEMLAAPKSQHFKDRVMPFMLNQWANPFEPDQSQVKLITSPRP